MVFIVVLRYFLEVDSYFICSSAFDSDRNINEIFHLSCNILSLLFS